MKQLFAVLMVGLAAFLFWRAFTGWRRGEATISVPFWSLTATRAEDPLRYTFAVGGNVVKALVALSLAVWLLFFAP